MALALASTSAAQHRGPVRAAIGDVPAASVPNILGTSLMFNPPDGVWNHGEGFDRAGLAPGTPPADRGGLHGFDDGSGVVPGDIRVTTPPDPAGVPRGWMVESYLDADIFYRIPAGKSLNRIVGYLWPQELAPPAGGAFEAETAFEVFAPTSFEAPNTVIVIAIHPTITGGQHLWDYSGQYLDPSHIDGFQSGLRLTGAGDPPVRFWGDRDVVPIDRFAGESNSEFNIIAGYIMPPSNQGHLTLTAQRVLQFERVVQMLFDPARSPVPLLPGAPTTSDEVTFPVVLTGGSNGGQVSTVLTTMFPDRFHAAYATKFPMSMRRHLGEEAIWTYISSTQGFANSGEGFGLQYILPYTTFYRMRGTDWARGDAFHLWKNGQAKRPLYMLAADEDYTWTGEDLSMVMSGPIAGQRHGEGTAMGSDPFYWSVTDKECHDNASEFVVPTNLTTPGGFGPVSKDQAMGVLAILSKAKLEKMSNPLDPTDRPTLVAPPAGTSAGQLDGPPSSTFDSFHHDQALYRKSTSERRATLTSTSLLTEDLDFWRKQNGLGTWLGVGTSLAVDSQNRIYVGSADGVVTRLTKDATTGALRVDPTSQQAERCRNGTGTNADGPFSLGYAVSALDVQGDHLAVATFGRIYVHLTNDLGNPKSGTPFELPWIEQRPSQIAIVEGMFGGQSKQIVYNTWLGEFVVRDLESMECLARFTEPGMFRFVVSGAATTGPLGEDFSKPIWFSTARGHIVQVVLEQDPNGGKVEVRNASEHFGSAGPLLMTSNGQGARLAYYSADGTQQEGIYLYDLAATPALAPTDFIAASPADSSLFRAGHGPTQANQLGGLGLVELAGGAVPEHVVLHDGRLLYMPSGVSPVKLDTEPSGFAPMRIPSLHYAVAIAAADLDGIAGKDLIVATQNGQVTWLPSSVLRDDSGTALADFSREVLGNEWFGDGSPAANPGKNSTQSLSAGWGIAFGPGSPQETANAVQLIDLSGRRWSVDPATGTPTYLHTVPMERWNFDQDAEIEPAFPAPKPFRGLGYLGGVTGADLVARQTPVGSAIKDAGRDPIGIMGTGVTAERLLFLNQFHCAVAGILANIPGYGRVSPSYTNFLHYPGAVWLGYRNFAHTQIFAHGYLPFAYGGDVLVPSSGGPVRAFYWGGNPPTVIEPDPMTGQERVGTTAVDVLRGFSIGISPPTLSIWGTSTRGDSPNPGSSKQAHLRTVDANESLNSQSVRVAVWNNASPVVRVLAGTTGGSLQLFDGTADIHSLPVGDVFLHESDDLGFGGSALAVADVLGNGEPVIAFGTLYAHAGKTDTGFMANADMVASLHFFQLDDGTGTRSLLTEMDSIVFDGLGTWPKLFGVCGLAFVDVADEATDGIDPELIITTLNGDLVVLNLVLSGGGVQPGVVLYHQVFDGALGASNSIVFDPSSPSTIFVAGSMGTRKFTWSGPQ